MTLAEPTHAPVSQSADRFAEAPKRAVEAYCARFEQRADDLLVRLERNR